jgi:hypothetical protein
MALLSFPVVSMNLLYNAFATSLETLRTRKEISCPSRPFVNLQRRSLFEESSVRS